MAALESEQTPLVPGLRVPEGLLDLQGGAVTFFLVGDFSGHLLSAAIPFPVSPRSYRSAGFPVACPTPGVTGKEVATVTTRPGGPRAPAQWLLVQDGRGAWPQRVAGRLYLRFRQFIQPV